jgi:hypothetical protein
VRTLRQEGSAGNARGEKAEGRETKAAPAVLARLALVEVAYRVGLRGVPGPKRLDRLKKGGA